MKDDVWKNIRSAPKDGRKLLLYCKAKGPYVGYWDNEPGFMCWIPNNIPLEECESCSAWVPEPKYWCEIPKMFHM